MTTSPTQSVLESYGAGQHERCIVCGRSGRGLGLCFELQADRSVQADFDCDHRFEGYSNCLHGGVISSLLDGAMTNCLFAHGQTAVTAELTVRFRHPVVTGSAATVRAWLKRSSPPLHVLAGEIVQDGQVRATAVGKFMEKRSPDCPHPELP